MGKKIVGGKAFKGSPTSPKKIRVEVAKLAQPVGLDLLPIPPVKKSKKPRVDPKKPQHLIRTTTPNWVDALQEAATSQAAQAGLTIVRVRTNGSNREFIFQ